MFKKMVMFAASLASRGLGNKKTDIETKQLRVVSCFGHNGIPPCPYLRISQMNPKYYYCGKCGCGDKPNTWLLKNHKKYSKLDYPVLNCPLHMPGFSNYDPNFNTSEIKLRKEKIESMSPEDLQVIDITIGETDF